MIPDTIYTGDNVATLKTFPDACIDLVVTSPPYDNLRTYGGHTWDFEGVARELTRALKPGGVIVWVVADATVKGSETLTSMRQAIHFKDVCGLNVHDTMIYKTNKPPQNGNRYEPCWEYMFVLSKGAPSKWNAQREASMHPGVRHTGGMRGEDGKMKARTYNNRTGDTKVRENIWYLPRSPHSDGHERHGHPATYPVELAKLHILSWSNQGDVVLDPFAGSGTTCLAARDAWRQYVGIEINPEYVKIINRRLGLANIRESDSRAKNLSTQIMKPMLPTTEKPTQAGPVSGLSVIAGSGLCFASGGIAAFSNGSQVPELQIGWPVLWARHAVAAGYNPDGFVFETPGGKIRIFKTDEDFNWEIL